MKRKPRVSNPRKVVAYITQNGAWWSATASQWKKLAAAGRGLTGNAFTVRGKLYGDVDLDALATRLSVRPSAIRIDSYTDRSGYGRVAYSSVVPVVRPLDFDAEEWGWADNEVQGYIQRMM